jgi:hypothetical protein
MLRDEVVEKSRTHFMFINLSPENRTIFETMWKNILEQGRPQMRILRMPVTCWIPNATNTISEYVILIVLPLQQWFHEGA